MVELEQAIERLLGTVTFSLKGESVPLLDSVGKLSEQDLFSPMEQPPFSMARADGYALRSEDIRGADETHPVTLNLLGTVYAGTPTETILAPGQAFRITEGAMIPEGADCVIDAVYTDCSNETDVQVYTSGFYQQNISVAGGNVAKGQYLLRKWERINASQVGLLAASGVLTVPVYRPLRVGVLTTGEEIIDPHFPLEKGQIFDANSMMLRARIEALGMEAVAVHQKVGDDVHKTCAAIEELLPQVDLIVTTGGVSLGKHDLMEEVYAALSVTPLFEGIDFWPGRETCAGVYKRTIILSLSGSPTACLLTFDLLARPLCSKMSGEKEIGLRGVIATFKGELESKEPLEMRRFYFGLYDPENGIVEIPRGGLRPGGLLRASESNSFIEVPKGVRTIREGHQVRVVSL